MTGKELLGLVYDILANNPVEQQDRARIIDVIRYVDYDHSKIVFGDGELLTMDMRLYDHEEE